MKASDMIDNEGLQAVLSMWPSSAFVFNQIVHGLIIAIIVSAKALEHNRCRRRSMLQLGFEQ